MRLFHNRYLLSSPLITVLLAAIVLSGCSKKAEVDDDVRPVRVIQLVPEAQQLLAEYAGNVRPRVEANIGFRVNGKISSRKVDVGSMVKAGQLLMQLDPEDLRLTQLQAEGNFRAAQSNLDLANSELKRYQELRKTNAVSQSMLDAKTTAQAAAQGNFEQAQAQLKAQSNQAAYANLIAKSDGVVTALYAEVGQVVNAGTPVIQIAQLDELEVAVSIPENNVEIVKRANKVQIHLWASPGDAIEGKLRELSPVADASTRSFNAKVTIVNPSPKIAANLKMGMTANVQFALTTNSDFIKIPLTALFQEKGVTSVWVVEKNSVQLVPVKIAGISGNDLLISAGLNAGQSIVTAGVHLLKPHQRVTILEEPVKQEVQGEPYLSVQNLLKASADTQSNKAGAK